MSFASLCVFTYIPCLVPFKVSPQRTAKKFLQLEHPNAKKFLRFCHATAKKGFLRFPELKLKQPAISRKKNFCLRTQKEVLARALFLGGTVQSYNILYLRTSSNHRLGSAGLNALEELLFRCWQ